MRDFGVDILRDEKINEFRDENLKLAPNPIYLSPLPNVENVYLFQYEISNPKKPDQSKTVDYKVGVNCLEVYEDDTACIEFFKYNFFINKKQPSLIIDQIADEINDALYPIILHIDKRAELLSVENLDEIKERWTRKKSKLKLEYQGRIVDKIFQQVDNRINHKVNFELSLEKDVFISTFLSNLFGSYSTNLKSERGLLLPLSPGSSSFLIKGTYKLKRDITTYNTIFVEFEGTRSFNYQELKIFNKNPDAKIDINTKADFDLHQDTCLPKWIRLQSNFTDTSKNEVIKEITLNINKLQGEKNAKRLETELRKAEELKQEKEVQTRKKRFSIFNKR